MYLMDYSDNYYVRTKSFNLNTNKLNESLQCDVCIIGAGLSGISSALYLSKINPSLNIVILEKNKVGWGASGRNGGQLLHSFSGENYSGQKHTKEEIKTLWQFTLEAVREVKKNILTSSKPNTIMSQRHISLNLKWSSILRVHTINLQCMTQNVAKFII